MVGESYAARDLAALHVFEGTLREREAWCAIEIAASGNCCNYPESAVKDQPMASRSRYAEDW